MLILSSDKFISMCCIVHKGLNYAKRDIHDIFCGQNPLVVLIPRLDVVVRWVVLTLCDFLPFTLFQKFGSVHLKHVNFLSDVVDLISDLDECLLVQLLVFNINLNKKFPALLLFSEIDSVLSRQVLLSTDFDSGVNIKDGLRVIVDGEELFDLCFLVLLHVAIKKKCGIVLIVVCNRRWLHL